VTIILRPARAFDAASCATIIDEWMNATPWLPRVYERGEISWRLREEVFPRQEVTVAEIRREVAGFLALDRDAAVVTALYVVSQARGMGVGAGLLDSAKLGLSRLSLWTFEANMGARRFYARQGFVEGRRSTANAEGLPDVELTWSRG